MLTHIDDLGSHGNRLKRRFHHRFRGPDKRTTVRFVSAPGSTSSRLTPEMRSTASVICLIFERSRPSEKFGNALDYGLVNRHGASLMEGRESFKRGRGEVLAMLGAANRQDGNAIAMLVGADLPQAARHNTICLRPILAALCFYLGKGTCK